MAQASQLSPELSRGLLQLARALVVAARNWTLYPPEHPTVSMSVKRLAEAIHQSSLGAALSIGITPDTLVIEGTAADAQPGIAEAAALLHERDLLRVTFIGDVAADALHAFLRMLALDPAERRARGGPATIWGAEGHASLVLEQIDYQKVLQREQGEIAEPAKRDDLWRSIVTSIAGGQNAVLDERQQQRLLEIAGSPADIADLATAVAAPRCTLDGSPMITTQAATVLAAFRHLTSIVSVMSSERMPEVMGNLAAAATQLDAHVMMQMMQGEEDPGAGVPILRGLAHAFDDSKVAQLLATALALDGQASDRLATIFNTIAPDEDRKRRVLTMTRSLLSESDFGRTGQFQVLWTSMEELLVSYNDKPFVSETYKAALDGVGARADKMASGGDLPAELPAWMESLGQESVRGLSVIMLIDLLNIEKDAARAAEIAQDMEALAEDLLMSGAYADALTVATAMARRANSSLLGRDACRLALDRLGESLALRETAALVGDVEEDDWTAIKSVLETVGMPAIEALKPVIAVEPDTIGVSRAESTIVGFGAPAVARLSSLVADPRWFVQRRGARLLGRIASAAAVPLLQPLIRQTDPRVAREAISALAAIQDPAAARAIQTVLRSATGPLRKAVIEALVAGRDPRVVPMLARIIEESDPLGKDHEMVVETAVALGTVGTDGAIPPLLSLANRRRFFGGRKLRTLKSCSVEALARVGTERADAALRDAAKAGDRALKKVIAERMRG